MTWEVSEMNFTEFERKVLEAHNLPFQQCMLIFFGKTMLNTDVFVRSRPTTVYESLTPVHAVKYSFHFSQENYFSYSISHI